MVILDTSIIIDHLRTYGRDSALVKFRRQNPLEELGASTITIQELYEGKSTRDANREKDMLAIMAGLTILPYTYEVAKKAGEIARDMERKIGLGDMAIASTTICNQCQLFTLNKKDFENIPELVLI